MKPQYGRGARLVPLLPLAAGILLILPAVPVSASTPPILPWFTIGAPATVDPGSDLPVTAHWEKIAYSYWTVPDSVEVSLYSISTGERYHTYRMNRILPDGQDSSTTGDYAVVIPNSDLPAGSCMLVAVDPQSSTLARRPVLLPGPGGQKTASPTPTPFRDVVPDTLPEIRLFP